MAHISPEFATQIAAAQNSATTTPKGKFSARFESNYKPDIFFRPNPAFGTSAIVGSYIPQRQVPDSVFTDFAMFPPERINGVMNLVIRVKFIVNVSRDVWNMAFYQNLQAKRFGERFWWLPDNSPAQQTMLFQGVWYDGVDSNAYNVSSIVGNKVLRAADDAETWNGIQDIAQEIQVLKKRHS